MQRLRNFRETSATSLAVAAPPSTCTRQYCISYTRILLVHGPHSAQYSTAGMQYAVRIHIFKKVRQQSLAGYADLHTESKRLHHRTEYSQKQLHIEFCIPTVQPRRQTETCFFYYIQ